MADISCNWDLYFDAIPIRPRVPEDPTLLTNFDIDRLPLYRRAIELYKRRYNEDILWISDEATNIYGDPVRGCVSLHTSVHKELGPFWRIYEALRDGKYCSITFKKPMEYRHWRSEFGTFKRRLEKKAEENGIIIVDYLSAF